MYSNLRSLIFKLDPEKAHFLAIQSLKLNLVSNIFDEIKNDPLLKTKLFGCMSQRAAANIQDEMEALGPVRLTEVQEAQKQIRAVARRLSDEGSIVLAGRGGDDYV